MKYFKDYYPTIGFTGDNDPKAKDSFLATNSHKTGSMIHAVYYFQTEYRDI